MGKPSSQRQTPSQIGFSTNFGGSQRHCETPLHQALGPRPLRIFHTLQGLIQRNNWIFEVLFPKCSSCLDSSLDVVFTRGVVVFFSCILGCLHFPKGFCFLGLLWLLHTHCPAHFCRRQTTLSSLFLQCPGTTPDRRRTNHDLPGEGPHLSFSMWSTLMYDFHVPTSSARSVNSSGLFLTVTSG